MSLAKRDAPQLHRVATLINMLQARSQGETLKEYGPVPSMEHTSLIIKGEQSAREG